MAKFLPWAEKAQLCVLQDEFKNVTIDRLKDAFTGYQMRLTYSVLDGVYTVNFRQTDQITVEMIAFVHDDKVSDLWGLSTICRDERKSSLYCQIYSNMSTSAPDSDVP